MKHLYVCAALFLAGCAANAQPAAQSVPPAELGAVLSAHPLYGTLAQYDRQIAALQATLHNRELSRAGSDLDASIAAVRGEVAAAAARVNAVVREKAGAYAAREDAAASAILAQADASAPSQSDVRAKLQRAYEAQYAQLRSGADRDMESYRRGLLSEQDAAYRAFVQSMQNRTQQAYAARAQELRERESTLGLDLSRAHAARRLQLRAKLQTLYLRPEQRKAYMAQLQTLQHGEDAQLNALRERDAQTLAQYRSTLLAQADADIAKTSADLTARTAANLAARRDVLAAQRTAAAAHLPLRTPANPNAMQGPDPRTALAHLREGSRGRLQAAADATLAAYDKAQNGLETRFGALRDQNAASTAETHSQIAQLRQDRASLYERMTAQIAAAEQSERAKCGCTNVTQAVRKDLQSLL